MRILAGGPARETESEMFRLHVEGLEAQTWSEFTRPNFASAREPGAPSFDLTIRHELVPDDHGPRWHAEKIERVAKARQGFMDACRVGTHEFVEDNGDGTATYRARSHEELLSDPDALFLVDTDVILGPGVLERMWAVDADVVYGVFWTEAEWGNGSPIWPQVWDVHPYRFLSGTWDALNAPGVNEVEVLGGGACTLIRGRGFESRYWPLLESIRHIGGMWGGEDRTFCLGLECRQVRQVAVTGLPIVHCYSESDRTPEALERAREEVGL